MKISFIVLLMSVMTFKLSASTSCERLEWAQQQDRSQIGVWVQFPGKGVSRSLSKANVLAEGRALDKLVSECGVAHHQIKFFERCEDFKKGTHRVFVRASIKRKYCRQGQYASEESVEKYRSKELHRKLLNYRSYLAEHQVNKGACNEARPQKCFLKANEEWKLGNVVLAAKYAQRACDYGDIYSCGFLGFLHVKMGNLHKAKVHLERACKAGDELSCEELKDIHTFIKEQL